MVGLGGVLVVWGWMWVGFAGRKFGLVQMEVKWRKRCMDFQGIREGGNMVGVAGVGCWTSTVGGCGGGWDLPAGSLV